MNRQNTDIIIFMMISLNILFFACDSDNTSNNQTPNNQIPVHCESEKNQINCYNKCINPNINSNHCGAKGNCTNPSTTNPNYYGKKCKLNESCINGSCTEICKINEIMCNNKCIIPSTDVEHCGAKGTCSSSDSTSPDFQGIKCADNASCFKGSCIEACLNNTIKCNNKCINPKNNNEYCGAKGTCSNLNPLNPNFHGITCTTSEKCINGICTVSKTDEYYLLSSNIIRNYRLEDIPDKEKFTLIDFSQPQYAKSASQKYVKVGTHALEWKYTQKHWDFEIPPDLSKYQSISFMIYVPENAVNQSFLLSFLSENPDTEGADYYGTMVSWDLPGWHQFTFALKKFNINRAPKSWNKLDKLRLSATGWEQNNEDTTTIYISNFYLHENFPAINLNIPSIEDAFFYLNGSRAIIDNQLIKITPDDKAYVYKKDNVFWLPLSVFASRYDKNSRYNTTQNILEMTLNNKKYIFNPNDNTISIDNDINTPKCKIQRQNDTPFVLQSYIEALFNYKSSYTDEMGLLYLSKNTENELSKLPLLKRLSLIYETIFIRPTGQDIFNGMKAHLKKNEHPRLMLRNTDFEKLKKYLSHERFQKYYNELASKHHYGPDSKKFTEAPVVYEKSDGKRLLPVSRKAKDKILHWSLFFKLSNDHRYIDRLWKEIDALIKFPDWNPDHFLDTAEILFPMAIAYDWLYEHWTPEQRQKMEKATLELGFKPALEHYNGIKSRWYPNNWSAVSNAGLISAAIAFADAFPNECAQILQSALVDLEDSLYSYAPDGAYLESVGYWVYGTDYMHILIASLDSAIGTNYGIYNSPGFAHSAYFPTYLSSHAGPWAFHDNTNRHIDNAILLWFAQKSNDPILKKLRLQTLENKYSHKHSYDLIWFTPEPPIDKFELKLDAYYSELGITTSRSSWETKALFTGLHGGSNNVNHGDLDIGNFIIFADNHEFIIELGSDEYNLPGYFSPKKRFQYYKKRAEGQNTLVIGDVSYEKPDQNLQATAKFQKTIYNDKSSIAILDTTSAYDTAKLSIRGLFFKNNRSTIIIQDELQLKSPQIIRWAIHTKDNINIASDGRSAILGTPPQQLYAEIISSDNSLTFAKTKANSYDPNYPINPREDDRSNINKLTIITKNKVENFNLAVAFKRIDDKNPQPDPNTLYKWIPMDKWNLE